MVRPSANKPLRKVVPAYNKKKQSELKHESNKELSMWDADNGIGRLYVLMDAIRQSRRAKLEELRKKEQEENPESNFELTRYFYLACMLSSRLVLS